MENELEKTLGVLSEASLRRSTMNSGQEKLGEDGDSYSLVTARKLSALLGRSGILHEQIPHGRDEEREQKDDHAQDAEV